MVQITFPRGSVPQEMRTQNSQILMTISAVAGPLIDHSRAARSRLSSTISAKANGENASIWGEHVLNTDRTTGPPFGNGAPGSEFSQHSFDHHPSSSTPSAEGWTRVAMMVAIAATIGILTTPTRLLSQIARSDVDAVARGHRASELIGSNVENEKRETVGSIDDIVIGSDGYSFAVLQIGGFLGVGAHLVAVPCRSLKIGDSIELPGATRDALRNFAEFKYRPCAAIGSACGEANPHP
jgi:hypothetical protein